MSSETARATVAPFSQAGDRSRRRQGYAARLTRLATLELVSYRRRAMLMAGAAGAALLVDLVSKVVAVAAAPQTLLFNVFTDSRLGLGTGAILVVAACSLLACVLPARTVAVGAGVALGGATGNLASRYLWADRGGSPDFIQIGRASCRERV